MENAVDALKMAAAVMVFVIALSVCINAFSQAKQTADVLISNADRETEYIYRNEEDAYFLDDENYTARVVNMVSIVPTIYRAYKENYRIVFEDFKELYYKEDTENLSNTTGIPMFSIDLEDVSLASGNQEEFLNGIMYRKFQKDGYGSDGYNNTGGVFTPRGSDIVDLGTRTSTGSIGKLFPGQVNERTPREYFQKTYQVTSQTWDCDSLYEQLKGASKIVEYLGTFYQEDEQVDATEIPTVDNSVPEANKTKKRVITYKKIS